MASSTAAPPTSLSPSSAKDVKIRELESALVALAQERTPEWYAGVFKELQSKLQDAARELRAKARELEALKQTHATDRARLLDSNTVAMRELEEDLERHKALRDEVQAVNAQQQHAITKFQEDWRMQDAKCNKLNTRVKGLETALATQRQHVSQLDGTNARLAADVKTVEIRLAAVCVEKANLDRCVTDQARDLCAAKIALESERTSAASLTLRVEELDGRCDTLMTERDNALARVGELLQADFSRVTVKLERHCIVGERDEAPARFATLQTEYEEVRQALPALREDYEANASELQRLRQKLADTTTLHRDLADARAEAAARTVERDDAIVLSGLALRERDVLSKRLAAMQSERQAYDEARRLSEGPVATTTVSTAMGLNAELAARDRIIQSLKDAKESFIARYAALQAQKTQLQRERDELSRDVAAVKSKLQAVVTDRDEAVHSLKIARDQVHAVVKERDRASDETMEMRKACKAAVAMIRTHNFTAYQNVRLRLQKNLPIPYLPETFHPTTGKGMHAQGLLQVFRALLSNFDEVLQSFGQQRAKEQEAVKREKAAVQRVEIVLAKYEEWLEHPRERHTHRNPYSTCLRILEDQEKETPIDCDVAPRLLEAFRKAVNCINRTVDRRIRVDDLRNRCNDLEAQRDMIAGQRTNYRQLSVAFKEHADNVLVMIIRPLYQLAAHATAAIGAPADSARARAIEDEVANLQLAAGCWEEQTNSLAAQLEELKSEGARPPPGKPSSQWSWTPVKRPRDPEPDPGVILWPTKRVRFE
ncbi:hypothetical protein EXIGLDRAFT_831480 [Exidia glandulosa HHB12029]|uniref:Uncharacterized protein n=1 Tax=Exidia glandulosa HHB12029 TaxID=1314781 RepID=A0A165MJ12_EXIGL|nr:hypothetical protein EXIGLDRAFT_831480 [Exidia glandulosa HHB12029]